MHNICIFWKLKILSRKTAEALNKKNTVGNIENIREFMATFKMYFFVFIFHLCV